MYLPMRVPALGPPLKLAGIAMGSSVMIRLNMTLLLQIAMLYGHDIDDRAWLKEMAAIIAAPGLAWYLPVSLCIQPSTAYQSHSRRCVSNDCQPAAWRSGHSLLRS